MSNLSARLLRYGTIFALLGGGAQLPAQKSFSGTPEVKQAIDRLGVLGSVLMIAAHPDDENTSLIAWFARGRKLRTGYLSLTRGEGGQNLIGSEQGDAMGVIRTRELLAARRIDGGEQFFTRAIDFGFSKSAAETLEKWGREQILSDVVWTIRRFRPDVIVLRFSGTPRDGHGHHQSSAILGKEAFAAAADAARFPEQLQWVEPWQAKRIVFNVFAFNREQEREASAAAGRLEVDTGEFDPVLGSSYNEIAGMSRSQHRSQGMGAAERKGSVKNYFLHVAGDAAKADVFDGIDTSWKRVPDADAVGRLFADAARAFRPDAPEAVVPLLVRGRTMLANRTDRWSAQKRREADEAIALAAGLWLDVSAERYETVPGSTLKLQASAVNRSKVSVMLEGVAFPDGRGVSPAAITAIELAYNRPWAGTFEWAIPIAEPYSQPYWLAQPKDGDRYSVTPQTLVGMAANPPTLSARFRLRIDGQEIEIERTVEHRYVDRVEGELVRPLAIVPPVALSLSQKTVLFPSAQQKKISVAVEAKIAGAAGRVRLALPAGWRAEPAEREFQLADAGEQTTVAFELIPPAAEGRGNLRAVANVGGREISSGVEVIRYPHIPPQTLSPPAKAELVRADVRVLARRVGYVMGAGDEVPQALRELGCEVALIERDELASGDLSRYDAIVTGVRAYNTRADLRANQQRLFDYARNGGTLLVQYNVLEGGFFGGDPKLLAKIGPYPIRIGRERVTVEDAPVAFQAPDSQLLLTPNRITPRDFEGWVQERGLYFAAEWDKQYQPILESHDPGEQPLAGGMLYAPLGKGAYVFSAYAWFRQLPAGVPGAYRVFANFLSAGKARQQQ